MYQNIFFIVLTIVVIIAGIAVIYFIGILKEVKKVVRKINNLIDTHSERASKTVTDIQGSVADLKNITAGIDKKLDKTNELFNVLEDISKNLRLPADILSKAAASITLNLASFSYALKEGIKSLYRKKD